MRYFRKLLLTIMISLSFLLSAFAPVVSIDKAGIDKIPGLDDSSPPIIDVWYGDNQQFGVEGTPQQWINILGNVSDPESGISSFTYRLNGNVMSPNPNIGPDNRRLILPGDFNIEIDKSLLNDGNNTVLIRAVNGDGILEERTVNFSYNESSIWGLPYSIDWASTSEVQEVLQIVDGKWSWSSNGIRTQEVGYDRVLAIGDMIWQDLEILVPVTIHDVDESAFGIWQSGYAAGVGVNIHWLGHTDVPVVCSQPHCGWEPTGGTAWHVWDQYGARYLQLSTDESLQSTITQFNENHTYWFKVRVEKEGTGYHYYMKSWEYGYSEPSSWSLDSLTTSDNQYFGSVLLVAHHVDATFGDVSITPVGGELTLSTSVSGGSGSILKSPEKNYYQYAENVTLTADPAPGYAFVSWGGALSGTTNPQELTMTDSTSVTATFEPISTFTLTVNESPSGSGNVLVDPMKTRYNPGEEVTLTAEPASGWTFSAWSGSISGSTNPITITMYSDKTITANFVENEYILTTASNPSTGGSIDISPLKTAYTAGEQVTLRAIPEEGWQFLTWSGDDNRDTEEITIIINSDMSITAIFLPFTHRLFIPIVIKGN